MPYVAPCSALHRPLKSVNVVLVLKGLLASESVFMQPQVSWRHLKVFSHPSFNFEFLRLSFLSKVMIPQTGTNMLCSHLSYVTQNS